MLFFTLAQDVDKLQDLYGKIKSETDFKEVLNGGIFNRKE